MGVAATPGCMAQPLEAYLLATCWLATAEQPTTPWNPHCPYPRVLRIAIGREDLMLAAKDDPSQLGGDALAALEVRAAAMPAYAPPPSSHTTHIHAHTYKYMHAGCYHAPFEHLLASPRPLWPAAHASPPTPTPLA